MSLLAVLIIAVSSLFLIVITNVFTFIYLSKLKKKIAILTIQMQSASLLVDELQITNAKLQHDVDETMIENKNFSIEITQVSQQLEHRIKIMKGQIDDQQQLIEQWSENQSQDKFYNRAFKLAAKGADIEEIMSECELPRAEVEMLLSVYQQRINN